MRLVFWLLSCDKLLYAFNSLLMGKTRKRDTEAHYFENSLAIFVNEVSNIDSIFLSIRLNRLYPSACIC